MTHAPVVGRFVAADAGACLLRFSLPPSLPIPLHVVRPDAVRLITWAFFGLEAGAEGGPVCWLALTAEGDLSGETLSLATHFREIAIRPERAPADTMSEPERVVVARALLSAGAPVLVPLGHLIRLVEPALTALPVADDAPELAAEAGGWTLRGAAIPHGLLIRTPAGWSCGRVVSSRLAFAGGPRQILALEPLWGPKPEGAVEGAVALHAHGFTPLATRSA